MSSAILTFYDTLAAATVTVGALSLAAKDLHQLPNAVSSAQLPIRLLLPVTNLAAREAGIVSYERLAFGGDDVQVNWSVRDLMLWDAIAQGKGLLTHAENLMSYCSGYVEMLRGLTEPASCHIVGASVTPGVYEYPIDGGQFYYGVEALIQVREWIN